jgi:hypothetical protein
MKLLRVLPSYLALAGIVAIQISCGDSSGPGASASSIAANSATTISAAPGAQVAELPSVVVSDENGNPIGGVHVTFSVTAGGGSVTGANVTSNASGVATVGSWRLGTAAGPNTLTATASGLAPITFTAQGQDPCATASAATHVLGSSTNGQLSVSDCNFGDGSFIDIYSINIPTAGTYLFTQTGSFNTYLWLFRPDASLVGQNDDFGATTKSVVKAILPVGTFLLGANSLNPNELGNYTLASAATADPVASCEDVWVQAGISTTQSLQSTDCVITGFYADEYLMHLTAQSSISVSMASTALDSFLEIYQLSASGAVLRASNDNRDGTTQDALLAFVAPVEATYVIRARATTAGVSGAYTISVQ